MQAGSGKTTISRLVPPDAALLTDEISYVRREGNRHLACGQAGVSMARTGRSGRNSFKRIGTPKVLPPVVLGWGKYLVWVASSASVKFVDRATVQTLG